jgi:ribosomal protein S18 acetylase RimI-like enzyme
VTATRTRRRGPSRPEGSLRIERLGPGQEGELLRAPQLFDEPPAPVAVRRYLAEPRNVFLMGYDGSRPVGFLRGTELDRIDTLRRQMFLYEIAVDEPYRRRGVGTALIARLREICKARGLVEIFVFTDDPDNVAAARLYRSTGAVTETRGDRMYVYRLPTRGPTGPVSSQG